MSRPAATVSRAVKRAAPAITRTPAIDDASFTAFREAIAAAAKSRIYAGLADLTRRQGFFWDRDFSHPFDPRKPAGSVSRARYARLAAEVKRILAWAIERGGTTLRDFLNPDGAPGYFFRELQVYGREGEPCRACGAPIQQVVLGQRSTFWCPKCQR